MSYYFLRSGQRYVVAMEFVDFDGQLHLVGESWTFERANFLPYDDGLSLFIVTDDGKERQIRLQDREGAQGAIVDRLSAHLTPVA